MTVIQKIRQKVQTKEFEFTIPHFFEEMTNDDLTFSDIEHAIVHGRIRRKFSRDPRGIRYEIVGLSLNGKVIAVIYRIKSTGKSHLLNFEKEFEHANLVHSLA